MFGQRARVLGAGSWVGSALLLASAWSPASAAANIDPCSLLTADEATAIIGPLSAGPMPEQGPTVQTPECGFISASDGGVILAVSDAATWETRKSFIRPSDHAVVVPGLGDEAIYADPDEGMYTLVVLARPYVLEIHSTVDSDDGQKLTTAIAEKAVPRLK